MIFPSLDFYRELILTADPHAEPFYTPCGWLANGPPHVHRCARHSAVPTSSNSGCISGEERQSRPLDDSGVLGRARSRVALQELQGLLIELLDLLIDGGVGTPFEDQHL